MSAFPTELIDRWQRRSEPAPDQGKLYWHVLFRGDPQVRTIVSTARERLSGFRGLHMTPQQWLHVTILTVGATENRTSSEIERLLAEAQAKLRRIPPVTVRLGRVLYHQEAIMLGVHPSSALRPVLRAVRSATRAVIGRDDGATGGQYEWVPHITVCYSTSSQSAGPIISALGTYLPPCEVTIDTVTLVDQHGGERNWDWRPVGTAHLQARSTGRPG